MSVRVHIDSCYHGECPYPLNMHELQRESYPAGQGGSLVATRPAPYHEACGTHGRCVKPMSNILDLSFDTVNPGEHCLVIAVMGLFCYFPSVPVKSYSGFCPEMTDRGSQTHDTPLIHKPAIRTQLVSVEGLFYLDSGQQHNLWIT